MSPHPPAWHTKGHFAQQGREHHTGGRTRHYQAQRANRGEYYVCARWEEGKQIVHTVGAVRLEDAVWDALSHMINDPDVVLARIEKLAGRHGSSIDCRRRRRAVQCSGQPSGAEVLRRSACLRLISA
jgi:hypothetical protein